MTAKYDESVQEQEKSCQMQTNVSSDAETVVPFAPVSTPAKIPDTKIPISLDTCTPVLGISSTSTPAASTELAPFDCDQCSSVFQDKMQLKAHLKKVHLKPYQCCECRLQFSKKEKLQNHVNKIHLKSNKNKNSHNTKTVGTKKLDIKNSELACQYCDKSFSSTQYVEILINTVHYKILLASQCWYGYIMMPKTSFRCRKLEKEVTFGII